MNRTLAVMLSALAAVSAQAELGVVILDSGRISGKRTDDGEVMSFKGVPFAAPPVGQLRWKAPQPVASWDGVRECTSLGPSPMQRKPEPFSMWSREFLIPEEPISEDCLYLNVWTGAQSRAERRPVLVWIYGGGFNSGGSGCPIYDGEAMARKGIVFVSINYRVGPFGFFAHPELSAESGHNASGNYGLLDQIAALRWVQRNIEAFGGDPGNVTIAGQSAGSMSVNCLVASPLGAGLFQRAIAESGASMTRGQPPLAQAEEAGREAARALGGGSIDELRSRPAGEIMRLRGGHGPVVDGHVLPASVAEIFAAGQENQVDLMTGWNEEEGLMFGPVKSAGEFRMQAMDQYGRDAEIFLAFFPAANDVEAALSQANLSRDILFGTQNYAWARQHALRGRRPVYVYRFTRKVPGTGEYARYGAFHTGEVPYAYDNLKFVDRPWEATDHRLAEAMSEYWSRFVRTGNPNGNGLAEWPVFETANKWTMYLGDTQEAEPMKDAAALEFLLQDRSGSNEQR